MQASAWVLGAILFGSCVGGCKTSGSAHTFPADPLLASKKPLEAKAENAAPVKVAYVEPVAPTTPAAVAAKRRSSSPGQGEEPVKPTAAEVTPRVTRAAGPDPTPAIP
jgi:hypothetical protein